MIRCIQRRRRYKQVQAFRKWHEEYLNIKRCLDTCEEMRDEETDKCERIKWLNLLLQLRWKQTMLLWNRPTKPRR